MHLRPTKRLAPMFAMAAVLLNVDAAFGCSTKDKAYVSAMKSDLRSIVAAETDYRKRHGSYAPSAEALGFKSISGVTPPAIVFTGDAAFSATTKHAMLTGSCFIYVGAMPAGLKPPEGIAEGDPWCEGIESPAQWSARVYGSFGILLLALTLATAFFFKVPKRTNWPGAALLVVTLAYLTVLGSMCGSVPVQPLLVLLLAGLGVFTFALWRRVGSGPFAS